jgi:RNA polymerase sigma-70 factor, ECF subfamily
VGVLPALEVVGPAPAVRLRRADREEAFRALYARAAPRLLAYARKVGGWADLAEDVVQETFVRYLSADLPVMTEDQAMSYLYRITTRLTIDRWRERERERRWLGRELASEALDEVAATAVPPPFDADLETALTRLKPRDRALLWLAYVEGRPHREIAAALDVAAPSVRVLLFRARRRMARILTEAGLAPPAPAAGRP